jgi:hypothetical protein
MEGVPREIAVVLMLFLASSGTVQQYLGLAGVAGYLVAVLAVVPLALRLGLPALRERLTEHRAAQLAVVTLLVLVAAFAVVYPHVDVHTPGHGSDRDDAATIATRQLLHGRYPYSTPTYLGNLVSQLPGGLVLAAPFVALGSSAYQNVFWLVVLFLLLRATAGDTRVALFASWLVLALSPALLREYLNGGDVIANAAAVLAFMLGVVCLPGTAGPLLSAFGLGLALAWRPNLWYWLPLLVAAAAAYRGPRLAAVCTGVAVLVAAAVTLPFYLPHRHAFAPLLTLQKVNRYDNVLPHSSEAVLGATTLLALALALAWRGRARVATLFASCALVQGFLLGFVVVLASADGRELDFSPLVLGYGLFFLIPGTFALVRSYASP